MNEEAVRSSYLSDHYNLPCPSCGSELYYSAENKKLTCDHCGYLEEVDHSNDKVIEKSLHDALSKVADFVPESVGKKVMDCGNCGAKFMVENDEIKVGCGFCGSTKVNVEAFEHNYIQPVGIIPFYVSRDEASAKFNKWIKQGWFHPSKLKKLAAIDNLHGMYIPFWTYDAQSESQWSGQAGHHYYETRMMRVNGRMQQQRIQKTRWTNRSGCLEHFFDDVLVVASDKLEQIYINKILPFRLEEVVNYDPRLMVGWEAEIYTQEVDNCYLRAEQVMQHRLRNMCSAQLGGDTQRNLHVSSDLHSQTFKHIMLPLWLCSYTYQNKIRHFTINGQTGKIYGQKPISYYKIAFCIALFILFLAGVWYLKHSGVLQGTMPF